MGKPSRAAAKGSSGPVAAVARRFASETRTGLVRRARRMNRQLAQAFPDAHCELDFTTPLELAVATIAAVLVKHDGHMRKLLGDLKVAPT